MGTPTTSNNITWNVPVTATVSGTIIGSIGVSKFADVAGNVNTVAASSTDNSVTYDVVDPSVVITTSDATLSAGETATITFTLSESSTNFVFGDVTPVTGGTLSGFS